MSLRLLATLPFLLLFLLTGAAPPARADNPFGVMLWPIAGEDFRLLASRAAGLGVAWFRPPAVFIDRWQPSGPCKGCAGLARSGLGLVLTIRNGGHDSPPHRPSTPPTDYDAFGKTLGNILDSWTPSYLVVENEENVGSFYSGNDSGRWDQTTAAAYGHELDIACAVAHSRGIACANGGLSSEAAAAVTWLDLIESGKADRACDFARRAFYTRDDADAGAALCAYRNPSSVPKELRARLLANADLLLPIYRSSQIDAVNFHWYGHDAGALATVADALSRATGKPAMSNEMGQRRWDADPAYVRPLLRAAFAVRLKVAVWFSLDTDDTLSLLNQDGTLRPSGEQFARQMSGRK